MKETLFARRERVCVCYLCISHSGLPVEARCGLTWRRDAGILQPLGALQPRTGSKCTEAPPSSSTQHASTGQNKLHPQRPNPIRKTSSHYQTVVSASTHRAKALLLQEMYGGSRALITHLVLFIFICQPYFIIKSMAWLSPPPTPKSLRQNPSNSSTDGWTPVADIPPLVFRRGNACHKNRVGFQSQLLWEEEGQARSVCL